MFADGQGHLRRGAQVRLLRAPGLGRAVINVRDAFGRRLASRLDRGEDFSLRDFHDYLMLNGNVPIALQRWEYLGRDDDLLRLDALGGMPVTVPR